MRGLQGNVKAQSGTEIPYFIGFQFGEGTSRNLEKQVTGGDGGIRTLGALLEHAHLANECLQPLGHVSAHTPDSPTKGDRARA